MRDKNIGKIIYTLRSCNNISQEKLARGLCSIPALSRIESSERIPDKLLFDALLQRLGKSPDKLECIVSARDYELYLFREGIQQNIIKRQYDEAKRMLDDYAEKKEAEERIHKQYILKMRAALSELADGDMEKSEVYLDEAISITMPQGIEEDLGSLLLSTTEIQLILMKVNHYDKKEGSEKIWDVLNRLNDYVKSHYTDEEELVKVYDKIVRAETRILLEREQYDRAVEISESVLDLLGKNGVLVNFYGILSMIIEGLNYLDNNQKLRKMQKWQNTLDQLYEEYGINKQEGVPFLLMENSQCEILLVNEVIQRGRKIRGMTQEKLSEDICTPENLSAIESGKRTPSIRNYDKLMEKLGIDKDFYNSFISAEHFEIHELKRECSRLIHLKKHGAAADVLEKIEVLIDNSIPINGQYILFNRTLLMKEQGKISVEDALRDCIKALKFTFDFNDGNFSTNVILSREEVKIINYIGLLYKQLNQTEKTICIYRKVIESYKSSKVSAKCHYIGNNLILVNLCTFLEESNYIEESLELTDFGIEQVLQCGRGSLLAKFLTNKACCYEKQGNKKACQQYLQQAFYVSDMMKNEYLCTAIKKYYEERYEKNDWY